MISSFSHRIFRSHIAYMLREWSILNKIEQNIIKTADCIVLGYEV